MRAKDSQIEQRHAGDKQDDGAKFVRSAVEIKQSNQRRTRTGAVEVEQKQGHGQSEEDRADHHRRQPTFYSKAGLQPAAQSPPTNGQPANGSSTTRRRGHVEDYTRAAETGQRKVTPPMIAVARPLADTEAASVDSIRRCPRQSPICGGYNCFARVFRAFPFDRSSPDHRTAQAAATKIVLLVLDGLGGLPRSSDGQTELEAARTPNMDRLARDGSLGLSQPLGSGMTPGSGPAHLALFGYDPIAQPVGRGVLEAIGVGMKVGPGEVASWEFLHARLPGRITDRRAGRIPSVEAQPLVDCLTSIRMQGAQADVRHVREHRFAVVMRGASLHAEIDDTDPQATGVPPLPVRALTPTAELSARLFQAWVAAAGELLSGQTKANGLTLRGFSTDPALPSFPASFGLRAGCVAVYPMYRGVAALVGMKVVDFEGETPVDEFAAVRRSWGDYDFIFIHVKKPDAAAKTATSRASFEPSKRSIRRSRSLDLQPDVLAITGLIRLPPSCEATRGIRCRL